MYRVVRPRHIATCCLLFTLLLCSCSGTGVVRFVSLNAGAIDPPPPNVWEFNAQECCHWEDENGDLNIAIHCHKSNLLAGRIGDVNIDASFVLTKPPAGMGRDYLVRDRETRVLLTSPISTMRFSSYMVIISVVRKGPSQYRCSYRLLMHTIAEQPFFNFLSANPGGVVCFGTFTSIPNQKRGQAIRDVSESNGWKRPARPIAPPNRPALSRTAASL